MDITIINFSFKPFYTFSLSISFSLQTLTLVVLYGTVIGPGCPLNALLLLYRQFVPLFKNIAFIKEAACC
jgi:hypothetical protein